MVAITRPAEATEALAARLREAGYAVLVTPAIRREPPGSWDSLDRGVAALRGGLYRGVLFTSPAAVESFVLRFQARRGGRPAGRFGAVEPEEPGVRLRGDVLVGAVGPGTAAALRAHGIAPGVIPAEGSGAALARALIEREGEALRGEIFLQPRAEGGREELAQGLSAAGARVDVVDAYRTVPASAEELSPLGRALASGGVRAVVFASPSAVDAVCAALGEGALDATTSVAIGHTTAQALSAHGARRIEVAATPDDHALFDAVRRAG